MQLVQEELADVLCFALSFANALDIDVSSAVQQKIIKNAEKYPADRFRGKFR
jgi:NTP pyrophosphatase (non-canonical NTP hydrolase)